MATDAPPGDDRGTARPDPAESSPPDSPTDTPEPPPKRAKTDAEAELSADEDAPTRRPARAFEAMSFVRATSSDAYFLSNSHRRNFASRKLGRDLLRGTSGKRISELLGPLDIAQLPRIALEAGEAAGPPHPPARTVHSRLALELQLRPERCAMYIAQMLGGFHLILYGVGDRMPVVRRVVRQAAAEHCGAAVVIQGAAGRALNVDRVLDAIESAVRVHTPAEPPLVHPAVPAMARMSRVAQRIWRVTHLLHHAAQHAPAAHPQRLFLGLVAFDHPLIHTSRLHTLLHALARCPYVHILASVTHIHAGLVLDGASGGFSHGLSSHAEERERPGRLPERDVPPAWLWHHCTTYVPPVTEMLHSRGATMTSSTSASAQFSGLATLKLPAALDLAGRGAKMQAAPGALPTAPISQTAALQVLNTITARARTLFTQLALLQLATADQASGEEETSIPRTPYAALVREATREFTASSDEGVKQLLSEVVDHGLVLVFRGPAAITSSHAIAAGDELLIPLAPSVLENLLAQVDT
ncbi:Origin recognition complex subunit 2 [Malassezia obtusa]|uniref:Origin recognition complex subunit 2 n=1 Tax=Malassezia obtusa TaxID=76774 RepID=A0AAF0IT08_9BASI|nr:Origin recognition complex subunit 2 [Malassezia obtusa]